MNRLALVLVLLAAALPARAQSQPSAGPGENPPAQHPPNPPELPHAPPVEEKEDTPTIFKLIIHPLRRGMLVRLPVIDTDPNRGTTGGVMPIWVLQEENSDRIRYIHAPSLTFNPTFRWIPTYRFYFYPDDDSALQARISASQQEERELMGMYQDGNLLGRDIDVDTKAQFNVDGARRFFGFGPDSPRTSEANYAEDYVLLRAGGAIPVREDSHWKLHAGDAMTAFKIKNGRTPNLTAFRDRFPGLGPVHRQQTNELTWGLLYDARDHGVTTSKGAYLNMSMGAAIRGLASAHDFTRYGFDGRVFHPWKPGQVTAAALQYDQVMGNAPFWMMSSLGGKESLRAYGEGRYVDRGAMTFNVEQRMTLMSVPLAGVTTDFELAPFAGVGTVFDTPGKASKRYARPVFGAAIRAVARPQVVGTMDFGYGQEGLKIFIDINYAF